MLTKKKKISRKEIRQDKLVETYYKTIAYFDENKSRLYLYVGALVVLIVGIIFYIQHRNERNQEAGVHLARVMDIYDSGAYLEAIEGRQGTPIRGLKFIVDEYGSTENGETAKIYLAHSYFMLGNIEESFKYYEDYGGGNDLFKATAIAGEAGYYAHKKEHKKAADLYKKASRLSEDNVLNPEYMLKASINYINAGQHEDAKDLLETIKKDYTSSSAFREVDKYLVQIN
jgi:tetratricopeptide (TPR) repeat protein